MVTFLRGRPHPIFALADVPHGAGRTMEEPPWSCWTRVVSDPIGDCPCCYYGSIPVSNGRGFFAGRSKTKYRLRSPTARMTHTNQPLGSGGWQSFRERLSGRADERTRRRMRAGTSNETKKHYNQPVSEQATIHLSGRRGGNVGSKRGRRGRRRLRGRQKRTTPRRGAPRERRGAPHFHPSPFPWKRRLRSRHTFL